MQARELGVAIVGAGRMGTQHAKAVAGLGGLATVVAAVDPDAEARESFEKLIPTARTYASVEELFAEHPVRPDVVHVCTAPAHTHAGVARAALEAGSHIYVEKPFVDDATVAEELLGLAREKGLKVCCGYQLLFQDVAREAQEFVSSPGSTVHIESYFAFRPRRTGSNVRLRISEEEQLLDILPHPSYLLLDSLHRAAPEHATEIEYLDVGERGSVLALVRRGPAQGVLSVTLEARPVDNTLRVIRSNGRIEVDFMRGTVERLQGAGTSALQKVLDPFRWAWQLTVGTAIALFRRAIGRGGGYLGLGQLLEQFYGSIRDGRPSPVSPELIADTVRVGDATREAIYRRGASPVAGQPAGEVVAVTGASGFLGRRLVRELRAEGRAVRAIARRRPPPWAREEGVEYVVADLGDTVPASLFMGCRSVLHLAAATSGGYDVHERDSIDATVHVVQAAADAGIEHVVYVSSLAVLDQKSAQGTLDEATPLLEGKEAGPYAWGKAMAEKEGARVAAERGVGLRIVRPGPIVDFGEFDPPGRLGRWVGSWFVAVGPAKESLYVVDVQFMARTLMWIEEHFDRAPPVLNALSPATESRRDLLERVRSANPKVRTVWLPRFALVVLSTLATVMQKVLRPGRPAINLANAFASTRYDTTLIASLRDDIERVGGDRSLDRGATTVGAGGE